MTELQSALDNAVLDALRESVGDDAEFLAELIDTFVADAPGQLESLRGSAVSGDAAGARRGAPTLKGNGLTFGARERASLCQQAQSAAGAGDLEAVLAQVDGIDQEWRRVQAELLAVRDAR